VAAQIEALRGATDFQGLGLRTTVACGPTEEEIQSAAQASDLLVMGSHGRTGLARVMLGSVAEAVAGTACCPLMIIKHPDIKIALPWGGHLPAWRSPGQESARFLNILVPLDGSPRSEMILEGVKELARAYEAVILLLMGISAPLRLPGVAPGEVTPADQTQVTSYLRQKQTALHKDGLMAETVVRTGDDAALDILEYAQERAVDLIAMTTHGWSGLQRWPLGSVAGKVLRASPVPVLLYRAWGEAK
jgi:nucleotide-binding universal stress UspA family protein